MNPDPNALYPLRFTPIFKEKIWGGHQLHSILNKPIPNLKTGESWEISAVDDNDSTIVNGRFAGITLKELIEEFKEKLVGRAVYEDHGLHFPLLVKFIDAAENLSVQLHPDDHLALKRHNSLGKAEMWYVIHAEKNAGVISGFKDGTDRQRYLSHLKNGKLEDLLHKEKVKAGDTIYIKPGLVHSIGKGILLAEIQQTSDITYRIFDWNRLDKNGQGRTLHTDLALDAIDFESNSQSKIPGKTTANQLQTLVENKYFKTRRLKLEADEYQWHQPEIQSFVILMCTKGRVELSCDQSREELVYGESILIPACFKTFSLSAKDAELLVVTA